MQRDLEDRKHIPGGICVAVDSNLGVLVGVEEGAIGSIPGNEGSIAQAWVNVRGGLRYFSRRSTHENKQIEVQIKQKEKRNDKMKTNAERL